MVTESGNVTRLPTVRAGPSGTVINPLFNTSFQSIKRRNSGSSGVLMTSRPSTGGSVSRRSRADDVEKLKLPKEFEENSRNMMLLEKRVENARKLQNIEDFTNRARSSTFTSIYSGSTTSFEDSQNSFAEVFSAADQESATWKVGDILQSLGEKDLDKENLVRLSNDLVTLLIENPHLKEDLVLSAFGNRIQLLLCHQVSEVRACGYRIARYILHNEDTLRMLIQLKMELFLTITLSQDNQAYSEKEQALKLIRQVVEFPNGVHTISVGIIRAIVAIAESSDDKLRFICIETLCETSLYSCSLVYKADGLKVILQTFIEGPYNIASCCLLTVLKLLELPETRKFIIEQANISYFVSTFSDVQSKNYTNIEKLQNNAFMLTIFLKTWSGLVSISQDNFSLIRDLINCLKFDIPNLRDILMDIFFDVLKIRTLPWIKNGNLFGNSTQQQQLDLAQDHQPTKASITPSAPERQHSFINHYTSLLLSVLIHCNISDRLVEIISESTDDLNRRKAIYLLSEMASLANNLIPHDVLFESDNFQKFLPIMTDSEQFSKIPSASIFQMAKLTGKLSKGRTMLSLEPFKKAMIQQDLKKFAPYKTTYKFDDNEFKRLLNDTRILTTKEYHHWNWDLISELMQGPLLNGRRLEETIRTTKVMKRLMSFFRPFKFRFSKISRKNKNSSKYVKVGCEIFEMLLHTEEGVRFLSENKLLAQIAECIAQVDPYSGITSPDSLFSRHKLETTMSSGYFQMLGVLSKDVNGLKMMEQWKMFSMFYHITEAKRDDLIKLIIKDMDYTIPSHLRIIFTKVLTTSNLELRVFTTNHLSTLLHHPDENNFIVKLLIDQLYDTDEKVVETAARIIDDYVMDLENLNKIVELRPNLFQLNKIGHSTLLRFLSTSKGYHYLNEYNIIGRELHEWINYKIFKYVYDVESMMISDLIQPELYNNLVFKQNTSLSNSSPQHFFGELVKIDEGVQLINESGFIEKISKRIKFHINNKSNVIDEDEIIQLKGYLWCIGHICSTNEGIKLFENRHLVEDIVTLTRTSTNLSIKGTCFLVLGLISKTSEGFEILDELNWSCKMNNNKQLIGICLPKDLQDFFKLESEAVKQNRFDDYTSVNSLFNNECNGLSSNDYIFMSKIFDNLINLLSHLLTSKAIANLKSLKFKNTSFFNSDRNKTILFKIICKLLANFKYSKNLRKYLLNDFIDSSNQLKSLCKKDRAKIH